MMAWIVFFAEGIIETALSIYFYDSFLEYKWNLRGKIICSMGLYAACIAEALFVEALSSEFYPLKILMLVLVNIIYIIVCYKASAFIGIFFAGSKVLMLILFESIIVGISQVAFGDKELARFLLLIPFALFFCTTFILRKQLTYLKQLLKHSSNKIYNFIWIPFSSVIAGFYFATLFVSGAIGSFEIFVSILLIVVNIAALFILQELLKKDEEIRLSAVQIEHKQNQLQAFRDMQSLYERQGKKLHDYKKQLATIQELLASGDVESATDYVEKLTKSISVEISEVNVGHPVINAVLNQQYRIAKEKGIGMTFAVSDLHDIRISDEDIVVLLGNLIENAIHECEKVILSGSNASIQVKFVEKDGNFILMVKNPVKQKVIIEDNKVQNTFGENHGIGLSNVEEVTAKYDGSFAIACTEEEFSAVVMI